jgi:Rrf2 family protein
VSVAELASREGIPEHFLSVILSDLRQRGLVRGRRGPDGGYQLNVDPRALSLADVVESLGGPLFPFTCLQRGLGAGARCNECPGRERCPAQLALGRASAAAYAALQSITLADLHGDRASEVERVSAPAAPSTVDLFPDGGATHEATAVRTALQPARRAAGKNNKGSRS